MVSRIEVIPSEVRGYGNIVGAKSVDDFVPVESDLVYSENVYSLTAVSGVYISLTASSSSINVGSSVTLSATVVEDDSPVSGVSVSFYDGSTSLGTATTNSNGVATYTTSSLTVGTHSLSATYDDKTSNSVSVIVNKLASTISLTVPASGTVGTAYTVTGTLVPSTGSVKLYENGSLKDTLTVSSGTFSKAITQSNEGTYSYYVVFEGSSTYDSITSSTSSIVVSDTPGPTPSYDGVSLTSDKSILSYADSDSCTLTAQLTDNGDPVNIEGVSVEFFYEGTSMGSVLTDSDGVASKTYASTGDGDISFTAKVGSLVSEIYSLEDCIDYDELTSNHNKFSLTAGNANINYSSNGLSMVGSANNTSLYKYTGTVPTNFILECDVVSLTLGAYDFSSEICVSHTTISNGKVSGSNKTRFGTFPDANYGNTGFIYTDVSQISAPYHLKVIIENGTATFYIENVQVHQRTTGTADVGIKSYNNRGAVIKNMKIKPL